MAAAEAGQLQDAAAAAAGVADGGQQQGEAPQLQPGAAAAGQPVLQQQGNLPLHLLLDDEMDAILGIQPPQPQQIADPPSPDMLPVTAAIAGLPHLQSLELKCSGLNLEAVDSLAQLTQLSRLTISGCHFDDAACISLVLSLTGLKRLSLGGSERVSDFSLVAISKALPQLTELKLDNCRGMSDRGVAQLTRLKELRLLWAQHANGISPQAAAAVLMRTARG